MATRRVRTVVAKELADYIEFYGVEETLNRLPPDKIIDPVIKTAYSELKRCYKTLQSLLVSEQ